METEAAKTIEKENITSSRQLSPMIHASDTALPGEKMVTIVAPKRFIITLSDGSRQRVEFPAGTYDVPERLSRHGYLAANGASVATGGAPKAEKPKLEGGIDKSLLTPEKLEEVDKFDQLKAIFLQVGGSADDIKGNTSKADLRAMITDKLGNGDK